MFVERIKTMRTKRILANENNTNYITVLKNGWYGREKYMHLLNYNIHHLEDNDISYIDLNVSMAWRPVTGEFPAQMASNTENVSIWWRHHFLVASMSAVRGLSRSLDT